MPNAAALAMAAAIAMIEEKVEEIGSGKHYRIHACGEAFHHEHDFYRLHLCHEGSIAQGGTAVQILQNL